MKSKVFIVNKSSHDFSPAKIHGELIYLTEGRMNRFATNHMIRKFTEAMRTSNKDDYILLCSLNVMNAVACAVFAQKHGTLNLLLFDNNSGQYIKRNHVIDS